MSSSHSDLGTGAPDISAPALFAEHVSKTFGGEKALSDVAFTVAPREVHGLLGQNGSGKSTLIKILAGFHAPDTGATLQVFGRPVPLPLVPGQFRGLGLAFVHQHLGLMPSLTVLENLMLSELATRAGAYINWARERQRAREVFARFGLDLDPSAKVEDLPQVERALLAIVRAFDDIRGERAVHDTPGILFLDEPTPFLPKEGVSQLFELVRGIVDEGASVIFVSHDVDEVLEITDRATILRDGRVAGTLETANALYADFVELIIGRRIEAFQAEAHDLRGAEVDVAVSGLTGGTVVDLSVNLHRGEVLGLTGLIGSGFDEVPYLLFGASRADSGSLQLQDKAYDLHNMSPQRAMEGGVALLPGDRLGTAGVGDLTLIDNITLPVLSSFHGLTGLKRRAMRRKASELGREFDVRPNVPERELESLSGGNQQKVLLAKWMQTSPSLMLLDEPTQGVDVGARQQVFEAIRDVAEQGAAVICASTDYGQLAAICDRVLIFARGRVVRELVGGDVTKDRIAEQTVLSLALGNQGEAGSASHSTEQVHG